MILFVIRLNKEFLFLKLLKKVKRIYIDILVLLYVWFIIIF